MAKVFRSWEVDHGWLLPPSLREFMPPGSMAHFVSDTVREALDLLAETACGQHGAPHRDTRPYPPRTNGMVERFNGRVHREVFGITL